jgi:hypothetical protein
MEWTVVLAGPARKSLKRIPAGDKTRILAALAEMQQDPFKVTSANYRAFLASVVALATGAFCSRLRPKPGRSWSRQSSGAHRRLIEPE